jgi:predicted lipid-binding transport protein (Tim44 family)
MGQGLQFLDIILFAAIAAFLVLRLRSVLGKRTGHDGGNRPDYDPFRQQQPKPGAKGDEGDDEKVIQLPGQRGEQAAPAPEARPAGEGVDGLTQIQLADREFDPASFEEGARVAFEMILMNFAEGNAKELRPLLANEVFKDFDGAIRERAKRNETLETTLVGITGADIIEAEMQVKTAFITVKFVSEQVNVTKDSEGRIVDGDPNEVVTVTDIWTFARNTRSRDPNWTLVATRTPN